MEFWRASHARLHLFPWFFVSLSSLGGRGGHLGIFTCLGLADCVFIVRPSSPSQLFCVTARRPGPAATLIPRLASVSHYPLPSPGAPTSFQQPNGFLGLVCLLFILQPAQALLPPGSLFFLLQLSLQSGGAFIFWHRRPSIGFIFCTRQSVFAWLRIAAAQRGVT